jgi:hypothetical protein
MAGLFQLAMLYYMHQLISAPALHQRAFIGPRMLGIAYRL